MAQSEIRDEFSDSGEISVLEGRFIYRIGDAEDPTALTPGSIKSLRYLGVDFEYDSTDASTSHDGATCIVTADGKRFKSDVEPLGSARLFVVEDKDLSTPPGSPSNGDTYIVGSSGTGDWASKDKNIAKYTARGWRFAAANEGDEAYVKDEAAKYHFNASSNWVAGSAGSALSDDEVGIDQLETGLGLAVENATTNTPPGSPSAGDSYIVGPSPTGDWAGHAAKLARYEDSAWAIRTPVAGWVVYDKNLQGLYQYSGSAWVAVISGIAQVTIEKNDGANTAVLEGSGSTYTAYDPTSAPTSSYRHKEDPNPVTHTALASGRTLLIEYEASVKYHSTGMDSIVPALYRDSETDPLRYEMVFMDFSNNSYDNMSRLRVRFWIESDDATSHDYTMRMHYQGSTQSSAFTFYDSVFSVTEYG